MALYYTNNLEIATRAKLRNWIVIKERQMRHNNVYAYMPFSLFDVGLKYYATMYVGTSDRLLDAKRLEALAQKHSTHPIIVFGEASVPEGVFIRVQDARARRAAFNFVHLGTALPTALVTYVDASEVFL